MFSSKIHIIEAPPSDNPIEVAQRAKPTVSGEGNPNLIAGGWGFPDDLGMSRADVYPSKHQNAWYTRLAVRWIM